MSDAIPAATLVLIRDRPGAAPALLMIRRAAGMRFAANALVFPGGRVDPGDRELTQAFAADDPDDMAARIAAIRETIEEVGVAVGLVPHPSPDATARIRAGLAQGGDFAALLAAEGIAPDPEALIPFARWRPNFPEARLFDTRFYLARAPDDAVAEADGGESHDAIWASAAEILAAADAGRHHIIFPTRRNLDRLATLSSFAEAQVHARACPVRLVTPWLEEREGEQWLCIPDDMGYPVTSERMDTVRRG